MDNKPKIYAGIGTATAAVLLLLLLINGTLNISAKRGQKWPPVNKPEIELANIEDPETYVSTFRSSADDVMEIPTDADDYGPSDQISDVDTQTSYDSSNNGPEGNHADLLASNETSSMEQRASETPSGSRNSEDAEAQAEAQRQQRANEINSSMTNRFSGKGNGGGKTSAADGETAAGGPGGKAPLTTSASVNVTPKSNLTGTIAIRVIVLKGGSIKSGSAAFAQTRSSGNAAADINLRKKCLQEVYKCNFARRSDDTAEREGYVIFTWK